MKRLLCIVLSCILIAGLWINLPVLASATDLTSENNQVVYAGGANPDEKHASSVPPLQNCEQEYTLSDGQKLHMNEDGVAISKTLQAVEGKENYFDITLQVSTLEELKEVMKAPDVAVTMVIDVSFSMVRSTNNPGGGSTTQYAMAYNAANRFIDTFCASAADNPNVKRKLSVVLFNTDAITAQGWTDCHDAGAGETIKTNYHSQAVEIFDKDVNGNKDPINGTYTTTCPYYSDPNKFTKQYTNIEGGLKLADNLLNDSAVSDIQNKYIILLTDGFPTTYCKNHSDTSIQKIEGYNPRTPGASADTEGQFFDELTGSPCAYGTSYSDRGAWYAQSAASSIKNSKVIFSIGINLDGQKIQELQRWGGNRTFSVVDCYYGQDDGSPDTPKDTDQSHYSASGYYLDTKSAVIADTNYVIGKVGQFTDGSYYKNWLKNAIGSGQYYDGNSTAQLDNAFSEILRLINVRTETESQALWAALDPVNGSSPSEMEFLHFWNSADQPADQLSGTPVVGGENTAEYRANSNTINWDLKSSGYSVAVPQESTEAQSVTIYTYTLNYRVRLKNELSSYQSQQTVPTNGITQLDYVVRQEDSLIKEGTIEFPVPQVLGYKADLEIQKIGADHLGSGLPNVSFTLSHCSDCPVCGGTVSIVDRQAQTDASGMLSITGIPSGHSYTLTETANPGSSYLLDSWQMTVAYGKITLLSNSGQTVVQLVNQPVTPVKVTPQAFKKLMGTSDVLQAGQFSFELKGENDQVLQTKTNAADGSVSFDAIELTEDGEYRFTITEKAGNDSGIWYDTTSYNYIVVVKRNTNNSLELHSASYTDAAGNTVQAENVCFYNWRIAPVNNALVVHKTLDDKAPEADQFSFELRDENDQVLQTKTNDKDGNITFETLRYTKPGNFLYTIREKPGDDETVFYDETVYWVQVAVTVNDQNQLETDVTYKRGQTGAETAQIIFANSSYTPVRAGLVAFKTMEDHEPGELSFEFVLLDTTGQERQEISRVRNNSSGEVIFDEIEYTHPGTYTYAIYEQAGNDEGIIYDAAVFTASVVVEQDPTTHQLIAAPAVYEGQNLKDDKPLFKNRYVEPDSIQVPVTIHKLLDGTEPKDGAFTFVLCQADEAGNPIEGGYYETAKNLGGEVRFTPLTFTQEGVYTYRVYELKESGIYNKISYDSSVYKLVITVNETIEITEDLPAEIEEEQDDEISGEESSGSSSDSENGGESGSESSGSSSDSENGGESGSESSGSSSDSENGGESGSESSSSSSDSEVDVSSTRSTVQMLGQRSSMPVLEYSMTITRLGNDNTYDQILFKNKTKTEEKHSESEDPSENDPSDPVLPGTLPSTGVDWSFSILTGIGAVLSAFGLKKRRKKGNGNHED